MKILYLQCNMGAAGDMLMAALIELLDKPKDFIEYMNNAKIPNVKYSISKSKKCGITGTSVNVLVNGVEEHCEQHKHHVHTHSTLKDINEIIDALNVSDTVKKAGKDIYKIIAKAESKVHDCEITNIHFHEVGTFDAIADIIGVCVLMEMINAKKIVASPVCVGTGEVKCAHGILPVPAPATALILEGVPIYGGEIKGELCTPTGAALLKYFVNEYAQMPSMLLEKTGYGMGKKDFAQSNCVRAILGEEFKACENNKQSCNTQMQVMDRVFELKCNLDDMTAEAISFACERLLNFGALDVYTLPIQMKKSRPGTMLVCLCKEEDKEKFSLLILKYTSTLGVRASLCERFGLNREVNSKDTKYGSIHIKNASGYDITRSKAEYEDVAALAREKDISYMEVLKILND